MQIVFNIDKSQIGDTIVDLFNNLTVEQKQSIAISIVKAWFEEPNTVERTAMEESVINKLRASNESDNLGLYNSERKQFKDMTDDEIRKTERFKKEMSSFKSSKTQMMESLRTEMTSYFKNQIKEEIEKDPRVTEVKTVALETIKEALPEIAAEAMVRNFMNQLFNQQYAVFNTAMRTDQLTNVITEIGQRIGGNLPHLNQTPIQGMITPPHPGM